MKTTANFINLFIFLLTSGLVLSGLMACNSSSNMQEADFNELINFENSIDQPGFEIQKNTIGHLANKNMQVLTIAEVGKIKSNDEKLGNLCDAYINKHVKLASKLMQYTDRMGMPISWDTNEAERVIAERMKAKNESFEEAVHHLLLNSYGDFVSYFVKHKHKLQQEYMVNTVYDEIEKVNTTQSVTYYASVVN